MQFVVSIPDPAFIPAALAGRADLLEIRLDLTGPISSEEAKTMFHDIPVPLILTVRSSSEGGMFRGSPKEWWDLLQPLLPHATYIDVEREFRDFAPVLRERGKKVIASYHTGSMPDGGALEAIREELSSYGDIPKIVVSPGSGDDVLTLLSFTLHAGKPIITSTMGARFSFARLMLPFFGSSFLFCHAGRPVAEGQVHILRAREILDPFL